MVKLIIFDVDGVLGKEEKIAKARRDAQIEYISAKQGLSREAAIQKRKEVQQSMSPDRRNTSAYIFEEAGFSRAEYFAVLNSVNPDGLVEPHDGCADLLRSLARDYPVVAYSNTPMNALRKTLEVLGVAQYFSKIYSTEDFSESKPSTLALHKILDDYRVSSSEAMLVGNSLEKDIMPAHRIGMITVLFDPAGKYGRPAQANHVISELLDIVPLVDA